MQGPDDGQVTPPSKCQREIERILANNKERTESNGSWKPETINDSFTLYRLIHKKDWPENSDKPLAAAFSDRAMSVFVAGGPFNEWGKSDIKEAIVQAGEDFVGAVSFQAGKVTELKYTVLHDPHPYYCNHAADWVESAQNHAEIICEKKGTAKREALREACTVSLSPQEFRQLCIEDNSAPKESTKILESSFTQPCANKPYQHYKLWIVAFMILLICLITTQCGTAH